MRLLARFLALACLAAALPAAAHEVMHGKIKIVHPWVMEAAGGEAKDLAVYMVIRNLAKSSDRLVGAKCDAASKAELALPAGPVAGPLEVKGEGELTMNAEGPRLMLRGVTRSLSAYDMLPLTLIFEKAGEVRIEIMVEEKG